MLIVSLSCYINDNADVGLSFTYFYYNLYSVKIVCYNINSVKIVIEVKNAK